MKLISQILFVSFLMILACPVMQSAANRLQNQCETTSCNTEKQNSNTNDDSDGCPFAMCKSCQCCFCCLIFPVEHKKLEIKVYQSSFKNNPSNQQIVLSDYSADCWQPPELI